jgi:DdrB-like protein
MENNENIQLLLRVIASQNPPNWQRPLKDYPKFDWSKMGATVVSSDAHGATKVSWCGHVYLRRSGENKKFGAAIWFSRSNGKGEGEETHYLKLITFKDSANAEPLPSYVAEALKGCPPSR